MIALQLDAAVLDGAATGELGLQLLGEFLDVDVLVVDAVDDGRELLKTPGVRVYADLLILLGQVLANAEVRRQSTFIANFHIVLYLVIYNSCINIFH